MKLICLIAVLFARVFQLSAAAATPALGVTGGGVTIEYSVGELLARSDTQSIAVTRDPSYGRAMSYRGVPLRALLSRLPPDSADTIQARAQEGLVAEIPRELINGAAIHG